MKGFRIEEIAQNIARIILLEQEMELSDDEKEKQEELADEIKAAGLTADGKEKELDEEDPEEEEELADAEEDEDEEMAAAEEDLDPKPKPDDTASEEEEDEGNKGGADFEVQAPDAIPQKIQYGQIEKQVNNLRAGKSLKDKVISRELQDYFKELGEGEKQALFTYLASISAILTGGTTGEEAPRPGTLNIDITPEKEKKEKEDVEIAVGLTDKDRSAPIVVGELADKYAELFYIFEQASQGDPHKCMSGEVVPFGSSQCVDDLENRITDAQYQRDNVQRGSADRSSLNGTLKYLRQKKRHASKISLTDQMEQEKLQARLNQADSE